MQKQCPATTNPALDIVVLSTKVTSCAAWPAIERDSLSEQRIHSVCPLVGTTDKVDDKAREAINASMDIEAPGLELLVSINMPEGIGALDLVDPVLENASPTARSQPKNK